MSRELGLNPSDATLIGVTNVHSSEAPDFSGMISFGLKTSLAPEQLKPIINPKTASEYFFVPKDKLVEFVVDKYIRTREMVGDGATVLMGALDRDQFNYVVQQIKVSRRRVEFGNLENGFLVKD